MTISDDSDHRFDRVSSTLGSAEDKPVIDAALNELAALAASGFVPAIVQLVVEVQNRGLAEQPVTKVLIAPDDIDDALQGTLIRMVTRITTFKPGARFVPWLHRLARDEALMLLRQREVRSEVVSDDFDENDRSIGRLLMLLAEESELETAMAGLEAGEGEVLRLREDEGLGYDEIALAVGVPIGDVRARLTNARRSVIATLAN